MKAYELRQAGCGIEGLRQVDRPEPRPGASDVVVEMRAAALNARDLQILAGVHPVGKAFPLVPLSDGVGTVVACGERVTRVGKGDRVAATFVQRWLHGPRSPDTWSSALGGDLALEDRHFNNALPDFLGRQVRLRQDVAVRRVILRHLADHLIQLVQRHFPAHGGRNDSLEFGALKNRVAAEGDSGDDQPGVSGARRRWHDRLFDYWRNLRLEVLLLLLLLLLSLPLLL